MRLCLFSLIGCLLLPTFAHADEKAMSRVLSQSPSIASFNICHSGGCADVSTTNLSSAEWQLLAEIFAAPSLDAEEERERISMAIGLFEQFVGEKTHTNTDRAGTFGNSDYPGQLDCNDEAINSTTYMKLLKQAGFMVFHKVIDTKRRGFFVDGWPHSTAAIEEIATGHQYAVDSWFYDNGAPAVIIPLEVWKSGWKPEDTEAH